MQSKLVQKIVDRKKSKIVGMMIAQKFIFNEDSTVVKVGWSLCNKADVFNKKIGTKIATDRCNSFDAEKDIHMVFCNDNVIFNFADSTRDLPFSMIEEIEKFVKRCASYFKGSEIYVHSILHKDDKFW